MTMMTWPQLLPPYKIKTCRYGNFLYNENDYYMGKALDLYGECSEAELSLLGQALRPGYTVLDIGANIGTHTLFFAKQVGPTGRVYSFEPQRIVHQQLVANIALNSLLNVQTYQAALGAEQGFVYVPPIDYLQQNNFGALSMSDQPIGEKITLMMLDELDLPACHVIKIDVEGMELQVLKGALKTIAKFRPILYVENDRKEKSAALIQFLLDLDYGLYWHLPLLYNKNNFFNNPENIYQRTISVNMLCIPKEIKSNINNMVKILRPDDHWQNLPPSSV